MTDCALQATVHRLMAGMVEKPSNYPQSHERGLEIERLLHEADDDFTTCARTTVYIPVRRYSISQNPCIGFPTGLVSMRQ